MPGLDLRILMGTNVPKRAGFFYGPEAGTPVFFTPEEGATSDDTENGVDYAVDGSYSGGTGARIANGCLGLESNQD